MALFHDDMCLLSGPSVGDAAYSISPSPPRCVFPLTKSQEGLWVEFQDDPTSTKYNFTLEWNLAGQGITEKSNIIVEVLKVINKLTKRHTLLRSSITVLNGKVHFQEFAPDTVDPEVRVIYREESALSETAVKQLLRRPVEIRNQLPARWLILQDAAVTRVYIVGHHIALDGQAMTILSGEFLKLLRDPNTVLPEPADYTKMHMIEKAWATSQAYQDARNILLQQVRNKNNVPWLELSDISRTETQDYRKIDSWVTFPKSELDEWSQLYKTSWFRVATALVGLLVIDRTRPSFNINEVLSIGFGSRPKEMASAVGHFANALPVKVPIWQALDPTTSDRSFKSLVAALGKNLSMVKKAEMLPPIDVVRACREQGLDYQPPRVTVTYSPKLAEEECRLFPVEGSWDLFFCFLEYETDVKLGIIYNPRVISQRDMSNMRARFETMVGLSRIEHVKLDRMLEWLPQYSSLPPSPTTAQSNPHRHIHHFFDAHAQSNPTSLALYSKELQQAITYGDLYASTESKARVLLSRGITRESVVVLRLRCRIAMIGWILSVLKTGAAFVYVDPDVPEAQMLLVSSNCKPSLVVDDHTAQDLMQSQVQQSSSTDISNDLGSKKYGTKDEDLAYMIYTSGSTGEPKGVMVEHGNVAAFVQAATKVFECGFGSRVLQLASFTFDASVLEWCTALCTGGTLCFSQYPKQLVGEYLADVLEENEINFLEITPSALASLPTDREYPALRQISMGGEAPSRQIFAQWHSRVNLVNTYGPTEAAVAVCFNAIDKTADLPGELSCGPPNAGVSIYVCSEDSSTILRPGCPGEVCLAGSQVTRGYRGKPEITARNFTVLNGVRVYRTGDRGKILEDGSLLILGRIDRELKIRGYRIAPEEVEKAIMDIGCGSQDVSVQPSEDGLELVAYVAPENVDTHQLLARLKDVLPSYKIPSNVVLARALPKSIAGKVNHKEIRLTRDKLEFSQTESASPRAPLPSHTNEEPLTHSQNNEDHDEVPASDIEDIIAQIWQEVLNSPSPPPSHVNFFDIGGHSLMVPKLLQKLKDTFSLPKLRLVELFHQSTIRQQVALCAGTNAKSAVKKTAKYHEHTPQAAGKSSLPSLYSSMPSTQVVTPASSTVSLEQSIPCHDVPIAIVGIAGRFPGAKTADQFYENLAKGYNGITKSTNVKEVLPGNLWVPKAGILQDIEDFDHEFWKLSLEDATDMDPQQRLFLDVAYEALTDAGMSIDTMNGRRTGLFVGSANHAYHLHTESVLTDSFLRENRGFVAPSISARTAYHLDISGPNVTVQTNCASSTVALSLACDAIRLGRCDVAVVGGVSVQLLDNGYVTGNGQIFSPRGECNPFDSRADGTVPADAVTAIVLKRATEARLDKTPTYANILGTACGSDGASEKAGFQVPSPRGIAEVIKSAWTNLTPEKLKYAEIHGSGTPIGDALELEGLSLGIKEAGGAAVPFTVGSTKGNMGNAQHASGLVSLIKLCKSMQKGLVPATRGCVELHAMVNQDLPLVFARQDTPLDRDDILAVSASGWGGVNSHVVMGFPEARLQKISTVHVPKGKFHRQRLAAPRRGKYIE